MEKEYIEIVDYIAEGIIRGAFEYDDFKSHIEYKLLDIIPKFIRDDEHDEERENLEFIEIREQIYDAVNNNWKVKDHNENIETIKNLRFGSKEYDDFHANRYK